MKRTEPRVEQITKEDYENRMGIRPEGSESKKVKDVGQPVGENPAKADEAPVPVSYTRPEAIKVLRERGFAYKDLKSKTKDQLIEMI